jgi:hypothetical protein
MPSKIIKLTTPPAPHCSEHIKIHTAVASSSSRSNTPHITTHSDGAGFPKGVQGMQPQGKPHGESSSYVSTDNDSADIISYASSEYYATVCAALEDVEEDPKMLPEVQPHSDWPHWKEVMDCELTTLEKARTCLLSCVHLAGTS